ncbi:MAG: T9SS type A sorting domain-containing protein [Dysgonamonadaceae bacterium]|jgi:hypothetical protein|nr:T9SS type A sorting domain-containing protein [Dysgonamonadaceae bacterium]
MKRIFILCSFMLLFTTAIFAQSFAFFKDATQLENNVEITVRNFTTTPIPEELEIPAGLSLKNLTDKALDAKMKQTVISYAGTGEELINWCFNVCSNVALTTTVLERTSRIAAYSFEENFHTNLIVYPGEYASAKVRYDLYPQNTFEVITVMVNFIYDENSQTGLDIPERNKINVYQEGKTVKFNYSCDQTNTQLEIYNIMGKKVALYHLNTGENQFLLSEQLPQGIYVYVLKGDRKTIVNQKFIVH